MGHGAPNSARCIDPAGIGALPQPVRSRPIAFTYRAAGSRRKIAVRYPETCLGDHECPST